MSYFDEIAVGAEVDLGRHRFAREEILRFARAFDPQPFHLDEAAAGASVFGALCASGWHTAAVFMRLNVAHIEQEMARRALAGLPLPRLGPSPGFEALRWLRPVRVGDTIGYRQTVTAKRASASRPGWGLVFSHVEACDEARNPVMTLKGRVFVSLADDQDRDR